MSANDLADRLDLIGAETEFRGVTIYKEDGVRLRAAAALLREQAEQLDTLRRNLGDGVVESLAGGGVPEEGA